MTRNTQRFHGVRLSANGSSSERRRALGQLRELGHRGAERDVDAARPLIAQPLASRIGPRLRRRSLSHASSIDGPEIRSRIAEDADRHPRSRGRTTSRAPRRPACRCRRSRRRSRRRCRDRSSSRVWRSATRARRRRAGGFGAAGLGDVTGASATCLPTASSFASEAASAAAARRVTLSSMTFDELLVRATRTPRGC